MHPVTELLLEVWNKHEKKLKLLKYSKTVPDDIIKYVRRTGMHSCEDADIRVIWQRSAGFTAENG